MAIEYDGISCPLPFRPVSWALGLGFLGLGVWQVVEGGYVWAAGALVVAAVFLTNKIGSRRIRVLEAKLVVEEQAGARFLLVGPSRSRVHWEDVKEVKVVGRALHLVTGGAPFVTAEGAPPNEVEALRVMVEKARAKAAKKAPGS